MKLTFKLHPVLNSYLINKFNFYNLGVEDSKFVISSYAHPRATNRYFKSFYELAKAIKQQNIES
jgi:hypothetical protein